MSPRLRNTPRSTSSAPSEEEEHQVVAGRKKWMNWALPVCTLIGVLICVLGEYSETTANDKPFWQSKCLVVRNFPPNGGTGRIGHSTVVEEDQRERISSLHPTEDQQVSNNRSIVDSDISSHSLSLGGSLAADTILPTLAADDTTMSPADSRRYDILCGFGNFLGFSSGIFWFVVLIPQMIWNLVRGTCDGLAFTQVWMNYAGAVINTANVYRLGREMPFNSRFCAVYFPICNMILLLQFALFERDRAKRRCFWVKVITIVVLTAIVATAVIWTLRPDPDNPTTPTELAQKAGQAIKIAFLLAIFFWSYEVIPQIVKNIHTQSCVAQAPLTVAIVFGGKTVDFVYQMVLDVEVEYQFLAYFSSLTAYLNVLQWVVWAERERERTGEKKGRTNSRREPVDREERHGDDIEELEVEERVDEQKTTLLDLEANSTPKATTREEYDEGSERMVAEKEDIFKEVAVDHDDREKCEDPPPPRPPAWFKPVVVLTIAVTVVGLPTKMVLNALLFHEPSEEDGREGGGSSVMIRQWTPTALAILALPTVLGAILLTYKFFPEKML